MTDHEVRVLLRGKVTLDRLGRWRRERKGPPFVEREGVVLYPRHEVEQWLRAGKVDPSISLN